MLELIAKLGGDKSGFDQMLKGAKVETAGFSKALEGAMGTLQRRLAAIFSAGYAINYVKNVAEWVRSLHDLSEQYSITTDEVQELEYVAKRSGIEAAEAGHGMQRLALLRQKAAEEGDPKALRVFARYGIGIKDLNNALVSNLDLMRKVGGAIAGKPIDSKIQADLFEMFHRKGAKLVQVLIELNERNPFPLLPQSDVDRIDEMSKKVDVLKLKLKQLTAGQLAEAYTWIPHLLFSLAVGVKLMVNELKVLWAFTTQGPHSAAETQRKGWSEIQRMKLEWNAPEPIKGWHFEAPTAKAKSELIEGAKGGKMQFVDPSKTAFNSESAMSEVEKAAFQTKTGEPSRPSLAVGGPPEPVGAGTKGFKPLYDTSDAELKARDAYEKAFLQLKEAEAELNEKLLGQHNELLMIAAKKKRLQEEIVDLWERAWDLHTGETADEARALELYKEAVGKQKEIAELKKPMKIKTQPNPLYEIGNFLGASPRTLNMAFGGKGDKEQATNNKLDVLHTDLVELRQQVEKGNANTIRLPQ